MVLQQKKPIVVWGWADPGESVRVELDDETATTKADANGNWRVSLPERDASAKPLQLSVTGNNKISINDILVGEVWLCSGQSNMEWGLGGAETGPQEIPNADFPNLRLIKINSRPSPYTVSDIQDNWRICKPDAVSDFSAVGYFFGKYLHKALDVPVGLIEAAWGGTRIEPWTPRVGFESQSTLTDIVKKIDEANKVYRQQLPAKMDAIEEWVARARKALANDTEIPVSPDWPVHPIYSSGHPTEPTCLYNSRIHPIVPFAIRGAIWYQGESNVGEGMLYLEKTKALIAGWREVWNDASLAFYFVQLAPFKGYGAGALAQIWEAQTAALGIDHTGMAVISDVGNIDDIHPRNKRDVGKRLALWALAKNYGRDDIVYSGPLFKAMTVTGNKAEITFSHTGDGLTTRDGKDPDCFEIAGENKEFHPAKAQISGNKVIVSSEEVASPVAVRFAWDNIAEPNLANKNGLPASSFRTDQW